MTDEKTFSKVVRSGVMASHTPTMVGGKATDVALGLEGNTHATIYAHTGTRIHTH
jgi:hypothetical protein